MSDEMSLERAQKKNKATIKNLINNRKTNILGSSR